MSSVWFLSVAGISQLPLHLNGGFLWTIYSFTFSQSTLVHTCLTYVPFIPTPSLIVWQHSPCHQTLWLQFSRTSPHFIKIMCHICMKTANKQYSPTTRVHLNRWIILSSSSRKIKGESSKCQDDFELHEARAVMSPMISSPFFLLSTKNKNFTPLKAHVSDSSGREQVNFWFKMLS